MLLLLDGSEQAADSASTMVSYDFYEKIRCCDEKDFVGRVAVQLAVAFARWRMGVSGLQRHRPQKQHEAQNRRFLSVGEAK